LAGEAKGEARGWGGAMQKKKKVKGKYVPAEKLTDAGGREYEAIV